MSIDFNECLYLNAEKDNASSMLKKCINGSGDLAWPCSDRIKMDKDILSNVTERPSGDNVPGGLYHSRSNLVHADYAPIKDNEPIKDNLAGHSAVEGFTNMGESYVRPGDCPDGYFWCNKSKKCKQVCMNCKYNERTHSKSKEFNEFDGCFPNQGVYDGITNQGLTKCTCGTDNQYCGDNFTAQGGMSIDKVFIMNVGDYKSLSKLAAY